MQLESLQLANFCQHRNYQIEFGPGLTGVIGPNGSGKSNLFAAVTYALLGELITAGNKESNVCSLAPRSERSYVELGFSHQGRRARIRRQLRPAAKATLELEGEPETIRGEKEVTQRILALLQIDASLLRDVAIVPQKELFSFLDHTPAERAKAFSRLFRTELAEQVWTAVGRRLSPSAAQAVSSDECRRAIAELQRQRADLAAELFLNDPERLNAERAAQAEIADRYARIYDLTGQVRNWQGRLSNAEQLAGGLAAELQSLDEQLAAAQQSEAQRRSQAEQARELLQAVQRWQQQESERENCRRVIAELQRQQQGCAHPYLPPDLPPPSQRPALAEQLTELAAEKLTLLARLRSFQPATGLANCPVCNTPVATLQPALDLDRQRLQAIEPQVEEIQRRLTQARHYDEACQRHAQQVAQLASQQAAAEARLSGLSVAPPPPCDVQQLERIWHAHQSDLQRLRLLSQSRAELAQRLAVQQAEVRHASGQLASLGERLAQIPATTAEQSAAAAAAIRELSQRRDAALQARGRWQLMEAQLADCSRRLAEAEAAERREAAQRQWQTILGECRDLLHREAAPRFVAQRNLARLEEAVNENLGIFDAEFRVEADQGLGFWAYFPNGNRQPAERLSAGQQVVLALSFRLALNCMLTRLSFLALDEPTAYLDERHIAGFEPVLERLRSLASSRGLQCVIITHESSLAPLFDTVLQLGRPPQSDEL